MTTALFWDKLAERYAAQPVKDLPAYEATLARTRSHLSKTDRVLEIGCGTGTTALKLADAAGDITATDYSPGMIGIARRKAEAAGARNVRFEVARAGDARVGETPYDAVLAFNLLHLVGDLRFTLASVAETLRPGGVFISKTPCLGDRRWLFGPMIGAMRLVGKAPSVLLFTQDELDTAIEQAGFRIVETGGYPRARNHFVVARKL